MEKHFVGKSSTVQSKKDLWQTPEELFLALDIEFDFDLDVCASKENALCDLYFSEERCALKYDWVNPVDDYSVAGIRAAFINPPYSKTKEFMGMALWNAKQFNMTVVALVNANTDTGWFADAAKTANEIRLITGRVGFVKPDGGKANGNTKGQCLIIWRGACNSPCQINMVDRKDLYQA